VYPDDYHLHTLDQFLSAVARLHPMVNVKSIVIGLMDRLSAYAAREAELKTPEQRKIIEDNALASLLENIHVSDTTSSITASSHNGNEDNEEPAQDTASEATKVDESEGPTKSDSESVTKSKGSAGAIPDDIKLFEIFHEQVITLVKMQRLQVWDTMALLVSLTNLAL
jgi:vacuolar protein sorting-associated protein 35